MKFTVTLKDPDGLHTSLEDCDFGGTPSDLSPEEQEAVTAMRADKAREFASTWLEYGEYVQLEFDTDAGTCTVVKP